MRLTWKDIDAGVKTLVSDIRKNETSYTLVMGILRGGAPLATMLSHILGIPMGVIGITGYTPENPERVYRECYGSVTSIKGLKKEDKVLLVDDIIDYGNTLCAAMSFLPSKKIDICCLLSKIKAPRNTLPLANMKMLDQIFVYRYVNPQCWVNFPWEATSEQKKK